MAAPKGSQYWKLRKSFAGARKFKTKKDLWEAAVTYFDWIVANPIKKEEIFHHQGKITRTHIKKDRPMSISGFCAHAGISYEAYCRNYVGHELFGDVCSEIEQIVYNQQYEGAAAGIFNHAIIARKLGLSEKSEISGKDGSELVVQVVNFSETKDK